MWVAWLGLLGLGGCPTPVAVDLLVDSSFEAWCDGVLCHWEVLSGEVRRTSTWHELDYGVSLDSPDAAIRQVYPSWYDGCVIVEVLTEGPGAVEVELDFDNDGSLEHDFVFQGGEWRQQEVLVAAPVFYQGIGVTVRRTGEVVTLGHVRVRQGLDRRGTPLSCGMRPETPLALGLPCGTDAGCAEGTCEVYWPERGDLAAPDDWQEPARTCSECGDDEDCSGGDVCGVAGVSGAFLARVCEAASSGPLGSVCGSGAECASGTCARGVCAECDLSASPSCQCRLRGGVTQMCDIGPRDRGEVCLENRDCASNACQGEELRECLSRRGACSEDVDCPGDDVCVSLGVRDGQCG